MFFFGNKIEKQLTDIAHKHPEIEFKYVNGNKPVSSRILNVNREGFAIIGFDGLLKQKEIDVRVVTTQETFVASIKRSGRDFKGRMIFFCDFPKTIHSGTNLRSTPRFFIYPNGIVKALFNTNQGQKSATFTIWDFSEKGLSMVNESKISFQIGSKLYQSFVKIKDLDAHIINLQIINRRSQSIGGKKVEILGCKFNSKSPAMEQMLIAARRLDSQPTETQ